MTTTYKLLQQYFLERDDSQTTTSGGGYYYGSGGGEGTTTDNDPFNNRFNSIEVDQRFNPNITSAFAKRVYAIKTDINGKIIIGGSFTTIGGVTRNNIARLNSDGTLDTGFNPNANSEVYTIAIQPDNKIIISGIFNTVGGVTRNRIARLNSDGTLDTEFNPNVSGDSPIFVTSIIIQPDGKIVIGGKFTTVGGVTRNRIARLNSDGTLDTGFNPNANDKVESLAIQADNKILVGGDFTTIGGVTRNRIARLNSDGTLDTGFNPNANASVFSIGIQSDGKIMIGGNLTTVGAVTRNRIARLNSDGTLDNGFNPSDGANEGVRALVIQPDGKILVGGFFFQVNGVQREKFARLNSDGTLDNNLNLQLNDAVLSIHIDLVGNILIGGIFELAGEAIRTNIVRIKEIVDNAPYKLIYTVPASTNVILGSIFSTNHNNFSVFYDIAVVPYEDSLVSEKHYYIWDNILEDNNFEVLKDKLTLSSGDKIYVYSSTDENISFNIFGTEITV